MEYNNNYYEGVFWIPEKEDCKIIGTLFIDENGDVTISSLQSFTTNDSFDRDWNKIEIVFGYINSHNKSDTYSIIIYDVHKIQQTNGPLAKYKYKSFKSFISSNYDNKIGSSTYNSIMLSSNIINNWIPITGFNFNSDIENTYKINQLYEQPQRIELFKNKDFDIYLFFRASAGFKSRRNSFINEIVFINIETTNSYEIDELFKIKTIIERLLNILLFIPFYSTDVEIRTISKTTYKSLKINNNLNSSLGKKIDFGTFKDNSQDIFSNWFNKQSDLELALINFFSVYGQKGVLIENKFLTYISVLENYHKNNIKKNGVVLKDRLKYLFENSIINAKIDNIDNYTEILKITRNYHAHLEERHKEKSLTAEGINKANVILEFVIREIFLSEIGLNDAVKIPSGIDKYL